MGPPEIDVELARLAGGAAAGMLDELCDVYGDAYGHERGREEGFRKRAGAAFGVDGFELVTGRIDGELVGFAFGHPLPAETWWWDGLSPEPPGGFTVETGQRTVVLSEIEVRRELQRQGLGRRLHDEFLAGRSEERATLATGAGVPAGAVYARWGWDLVGEVPGGEASYYSAYDLFVLSLPLGR